MQNGRTNETTASAKKFEETKIGKMAYAEVGEGFATIFIRGLAQSAYTSA